MIFTQAHNKRINNKFIKKCLTLEKLTYMLEDFRLRIFVTVAKEKSFTKASELLGVTQSAVSQSIAALEKASGARLFERLKGETVLTPSGRIFLCYAEKVMEDFAAMSVIFTPVEETTVRVMADPQVFEYMTLNLLKDCLEAHPQIHLQRVDSDADVKVELVPVENKKGMLTLCYHPSETFASTELWKVLSYALEPVL